MYIPRSLSIRKILESKSCFLLGPRQTGKSSLIRREFADCRVYDLLHAETYLKLSRSPSRLAEEHRPGEQIVVIDEIQKLPSLLDEVHRLIEEKKIHFLLTGSSARKLRRGGVNLLGGRAWTRHLHPLTSLELGTRFDLDRALNRGLLPAIYFSEYPDEELRAYAGTYLKEEIADEGLTRNIPAFSRFLDVAAACHGKVLNFSKISNDAQVARTTVHEYFQILRDTLIAYEVPAWKHSVKRKPLSTSKFYLFDNGIVRYLQRRSKIDRGSPEFGEFLESFMVHELRAYADNCGGLSLHHWRTSQGAEVDFILGEQMAIEVKATGTVSSRDLKGLKFLREEGHLRRYLLVCLEETPRSVDGLEIVPLSHFLRGLWENQWI